MSRSFQNVLITSSSPDSLSQICLRFTFSHCFLLFILIHPLLCLSLFYSIITFFMKIFFASIVLMLFWLWFCMVFALCVLSMYSLSKVFSYTNLIYRETFALLFSIILYVIIIISAFVSWFWCELHFFIVITQFSYYFC